MPRSGLDVDSTRPQSARRAPVQVRRAAIPRRILLWAPTGQCEQIPSTLVPLWGPPLTLPPCDDVASSGDVVLLGFDPDTGALAFAQHLAAGLAGVVDLVLLSDGALAVGMRAYDALTLAPGTPQQVTLGEVGPVQGWSTLLVRFR